LRAFIRSVGKRTALAFALLPSLLFAGDAGAENGPQAAPAGAPASAITFIDGDRRETLARFAARIGLGPRELAARYGATGVVRCGSAVGTAQLVLSPDVIATAAHNLFDQAGRLRDDTERCRFEIAIAGKRQVVPLDLKRAVSGSSSPYADPAVNDWAVAPLMRPVLGVSPYPLAGAIAPPAAITLYAAARADGSAGFAIETCAAHRVTNRAASGVRELALDCSGESGTSGAAFLTADGRFAGIYVGFRSRTPQIAAPFSDEHYNFGVTAEGDFRRALIAAAGSPVYTSGTR
jgi:hypothetical protein